MDATGFSAFLTDVNSWITNHQSLLTVVALPFAAFLIKYISDSAAEKRAARERRLHLELSRRLKLADFRQAWINEVRGNFSDILSIASNPEARAGSDIDLINRKIFSVMLRLNPKETEAKALARKISELQDAQDEHLHGSVLELASLMNAYLKAEWDRLKKELEDYSEVERSK
ncbi:hypothetical protein [Leisingera sp. JC11]|uniref:hypothetical protein n=1 Tax=Leisingera sp. JC11 TaxID=3042469 RepID=UPI00345129B1